MICFGLIILASVVNISYFTYNKTENYLDELSSSALEEVLHQANATLGYRIKNYERVINTFYISDEFRKALTGKYDDKYEDLKANEGLRDFVESILNTYEYVPRVKVYNFNNYTYSGLIYKGSEITDESWKREVIANTAHSVLWVSTRAALPCKLHSQAGAGLDHAHPRRGPALSGPAGGAGQLSDWRRMGDAAEEGHRFGPVRPLVRLVSARRAGRVQVGLRPGEAML